VATIVPAGPATGRGRGGGRGPRRAEVRDGRGRCHDDGHDRR